MRDVELFTISGIPCALKNICHGNGINEYATVMDLYDAVEDSKTSDELVRNINRLKLVAGVFSVDRETTEYVRLKALTPLGGADILKVYK